MLEDALDSMELFIAHEAHSTMDTKPERVTIVMFLNTVRFERRSSHAPSSAAFRDDVWYGRKKNEYSQSTISVHTSVLIQGLADSCV